MAAKVNEKPNVPPAVIALAVLFLVALLGWLAYANLFAPPGTPPMTASQKVAQDWMLGMAKKSHGDFNKLSPDDQAAFRAKYPGAGFGYAQMAMQKLAKDNGYDK